MAINPRSGVQMQNGFILGGSNAVASNGLPSPSVGTYVPNGGGRVALPPTRVGGVHAIYQQGGILHSTVNTSFGALPPHAPARPVISQGLENHIPPAY
jgi:hypothetical protein